MSFRHAGVGPALTIAKLLAVGCSMLLHCSSCTGRWPSSLCCTVARRPALELPDFHRATLNAPAPQRHNQIALGPQDGDAAHRAHDHD